MSKIPGLVPQLEYLNFTSPNGVKAFLPKRDTIFEILSSYNNLSENNNKIINKAFQLVGWKAIEYTRGNPEKSMYNTAEGLDCSGMVCYILDNMRIYRPNYIRHCNEFRHETDISWIKIYSYGTYIQESQKIAWDLVFFSREGKRVNHMGIYIGTFDWTDYMIHAMTSLWNIVISPIVHGHIQWSNLEWSYSQIFFKNPIGYKRVI